MQNLFKNLCLLVKVVVKFEFWYMFSSSVAFQVDWGGASMIEAERILLRHALADPFNDRFVFLSDRWELSI